MSSRARAGDEPVYAAPRPSRRSRSEHRCPDHPADSPAFFPRFASTPRSGAAQGPKAAGIFARSGRSRLDPHQSFPSNAPRKESLGAARASRAHRRPGARSAPSFDGWSASRPTRSGSRRSRSRRWTARSSCSRPRPPPRLGWPSASAGSLETCARAVVGAAIRRRLRRRLRRERPAGQHGRSRSPARTDIAERVQPSLQLRPIHHRRRQPPRSRRRAGGRRAPRPGLQPAVPARAAGARQDPPAPRDRQLRARLRRRRHRPLHDRRVVHQPLHQRPRLPVARRASSTPTATPTCC